MAKYIPLSTVPRDLILFCILISLFYFSWWFRSGQSDNLFLYSLLFLGEVYHIIMAYTFWFTVRHPPVNNYPPSDSAYFPSVDIFIPVCGEPASIVRETVLAAKALKYPRYKIYILNDGYVAKKDNWQEIQSLTSELNVDSIMRHTPGGAKSGNVNNALRLTGGELVALFDADMVPTRDFLEKTVPYFRDSTLGFVQTPQYYKNSQTNAVTNGSWDQQQFFFGAIMAGKNNDNSAFICGTNVVLRRTTLEQVGGFEEDNIAEDFATSIYIHRKGWRSVYLTEVLAYGLAPLDLSAYTKQQLRWAKGSLEVLFDQNPLFQTGLSWRQKIHYLSSGLYYLNGLIILIDITMPLIFLYTGLQPVSVSTTSFAVYFLPFMFLSLYTLNIASAGQLSLSAFSFSYSSWFLQLLALFSTLFRIKLGFSVTPKSSKKVNYLPYVLPHISYVLLLSYAAVVAVHREGFTASVLTNIAWGSFSAILFFPFIIAAFNVRT